LGEGVREICSDFEQKNPAARATVIVATSHGESYAISEFSEHLASQTEPLTREASESILCDGLLTAFRGGAGVAWPGQTVSAACASASVAVALASARIAQGMCDVCLVVSLDVLSRVAHAGFRQIGAMSLNGCSPFDQQRDGTTIAEAGAVILVAAEGTRIAESARWKIRAQGFGQACDARHAVEPSADGVRTALQHALNDAGLRASDLTAIYWHGTGTVQNDRVEASAALALFGNAAPPGTTTKGAFGHAMGASAALSILAAGETITSGVLPAVAGLQHCEFPHLNIACGEPVKVKRGPVAVVASGFGGINCALVVSPV
jgi:3-oxoacyl-[acyl-carrier-protein] synthase II